MTICFWEQKLLASNALQLEFTYNEGKVQPPKVIQWNRMAILQLQLIDNQFAIDERLQAMNPLFDDFKRFFYT